MGCRAGQGGRAGEAGCGFWRACPALYPLQPLASQGKEEEEEEEATSGLSEVLSRDSRALGCQRRGLRAGEEGKQRVPAWTPANLEEDRESG